MHRRQRAAAMANFRHPWPTSAEALACRFHEGAVFTFPNALAPSPVWNTPLITRGLATHSLRMDRASNIQSRPVSLSHFPLEISGPQWVGRYPTSKSIGDLAPTFAKSVKSFIAPIQAGGGHVTVSATYRPPERAYLMHYAWLSPMVITRLMSLPWTACRSIGPILTI